MDPRMTPVEAESDQPENALPRDLDDIRANGDQPKNCD